MSTLVLTDARIYMGEFNISGDMNKVSIAVAADMLEDTVFGASYHTNKPGLKKIKFAQEGYVQFGSGTTTIDGRLRNKFATADVPVTCSYDGGDYQEIAFSFNALFAGYSLGAKIGELMKLTSEAEASGVNCQLYKGILAEDGKTARTTASNTPTQTLGAVTATQRAFMAIHLLAFTGTNVQFQLTSAVTDFSTTTQRIVSTNFTAVGSELKSVAGAITDTFWRVIWSGTFTSFNAVVNIGIQ